MTGNSPVLNLVLCGRRGSGKTSAARAILGETELQSVSNSPECVKHQGDVCGRRVSVVQMPALCGKPQEEVMEESFRCLSLCGPEGVQAFILVLPVAPVTDEDKGELQTIRDSFSSRVNDFTMILFTVDSDPTAPAVRDFIRDNKEIQELCQSCGGRYFVLNLKDQQQIPELLETVEKMSVESSRCCSNSMLIKTYMERISKLQTELQEVKQKRDIEGDHREHLKLWKEEEEELKKKHREELKTLRAQVEQERKQRVQQLKQKDDCMERDREKRKKEHDEEEKRRKKHEEAQRREWKQKLEASDRKFQLEKEQRENAEKKLEQLRREMKRERDAWDKDKDQIWERLHQDLKQNLEEVKQNLEEEKKNHRKLQEEFNWKRRKWTYPWFILSGFLLLFVCFYTQRVL